MNKLLIFFIILVILILKKNKKKNEQNKIIIDTVFLLKYSIKGIILKNTSEYNVNTKGMYLTYSSGNPVKKNIFKLPAIKLKSNGLLIITNKINEVLKDNLKDIEFVFTVQKDSFDLSNKGFYLEVFGSNKTRTSSFGKLSEEGNIETQVYGLAKGAFLNGSIWKRFDNKYYRTFIPWKKFIPPQQPANSKEIKKKILNLIKDVINNPYKFYFLRKN